jgi:membrane protein EpsK
MRAISKVAINAGSSYVSMGLSMIINLLLVPFVIRTLGKEVFGIVVLIQSFQFVVNMAGSGLNQAFVRLYALNYAKSDREQLAGYYSNAVFMVMFLVTPLAIGLTTLLTALVVPMFNIEPEMLFSARSLMVIFGAYCICNFLSSPYIAVCASTQKFYLQYFWEAVHLVVWALCVIVFLHQWPSIITYGLAYLTARLVFYIGMLITAKKVLPYCVYAYASVKWMKIREILSISTLVLIPNISANIYTHLNQMIINAFLGPLYNTYFAVCLVWQRMLAQILDAAGTVIAPQITTYQAGEKWAQVGEGLLRSTKYAFLVGLPIGGTMAIIPGPVFEVWLGSGYEIASVAMFWIAISLPWMGAQLPAISILIALGRYRFPSILAPAIAVLNLTIVLVGIKWFSFSVITISAVLFICMFLRMGLIMPIYSAAQCRLSYWKYLKQSYCRGAVTFLPAGMFLFLAKGYIVEWNFLSLVGIIAIAALIYLVSLWFVALDAWDKTLIISYVHKLKFLGYLLGR